MRRSLCLTTAALLLAPGAARAEETAKALVERAVQALGGADLLPRFPAVHLRYKSKPVEGTFALPSERELFVEPGRSRWIRRDEIGGPMEIVIEGDKVWAGLNGKFAEAPPEGKSALEYLCDGRLLRRA